MAYTTAQGDTFDSIAKKIYGSEKFMTLLMAANPEYATVVIFPADINLETPELEPTQKTLTTGLPPWKQGA